MRKYILYFILLLILSPVRQAIAQNLILSGDFEAYTACPTDTAQIDFSPPYTSFPTAKGWVIPTHGTTDFFDTCAAAIIDVPQNMFGYQQAHSGGGYIGLHAYLDSGYNAGEYAETRLTATMTAGHQYYIAFYVNNNIWNANINFEAVDSMGLYLSDTMVNDFSASYLSFTPQLASAAGNYITDTASWLKVEGIHTASGTEQWAVLGKFISHTPVSHISTHVNGPLLPQAAYMFIDDVCITDITTPSVQPNVDTTICLSAFPVTLTASEQHDDYVQWDNGDTTHVRSIADTGTYWYIKVSNCIATVDTIKIHPRTTFDTTIYAAHDTILCAEDMPLTIQCTTIGDSIRWNTGDSTAAIVVGGAGTYTVRSYLDCVLYIDTFHVNTYPIPSALITQLDSFLVTGPFTTYQWYYNGNLITGANAQSWIAMQTGNYYVAVTDANGCHDLSDTVLVTITVSVRNLVPAAFSLSPNPVVDDLQVDGLPGAQLLITDLAGRTLVSRSLSGHDRLDFRDFVNGLYLYRVVSNGLTITRGKLLKQ